MPKLLIATAATLVAFTLSATTPSLAQTSSEGVMGKMNGHRMARTSKLLGQPVYNAKGEQIGTINDVLIVPSGGPAMVVISVGQGGGMVVAPATSFRMHGGKMETQLSLERMHKFVWNNFYGSGG